MNNVQIARAWKDSRFRSTLSASEAAALPANPAGSRLVEIGEEQLQGVAGAAVGCGWVCSFTTDCSGNLASRVWGC